MVGAVPLVVLNSGEETKQLLLELSDADWGLRFGVLVGNFPTLNYLGTLRVRPVTLRGTSFLEF